MRKRICICAVQTPFEWGGAEIHVESLRRELRQRDFDVELVQLPFCWASKSQIITNALAWRLLDLTHISGPPIDLVIATKYPSYVVQHPNKVVWLIHQFRPAYDLYGTPYSQFTESAEDQRVMQIIRSIDGRALGEARRIFTNAQNTANRLARYNNLRGEALYHPPKLAERLHNRSYGDYILSPSRLEAVKRIDLLLKSVALTSSEVRCVICGTGSDTDRLRALAEDLGITARVEFTGYVSDERLIELYANCFAVYYAPYDEDYGYVTLEAFYAHKPVITAKDSGGVLEFVQDSVNSYVCGQADPRQLAMRIEHLHQHRDLCQRLGDAGYERVKGISWDNVVSTLTAGI
ncbi:MAG: glycosyltransferase family 4 protein [Chloroflexi bacterium]|nr:glycosyltransferase family 4 protein [Chloroflexota bacterium]